MFQRGVSLLLGKANIKRCDLITLLKLIGTRPVGADADFTIVDLKARQTIRNDWIASKVGWTAYDGLDVIGWPTGTIVRGSPTMLDGQLIGTPRGRPADFQFASHVTNNAVKAS